jgi:hypothetical protein
MSRASAILTAARVRTRRRATARPATTGNACTQDDTCQSGACSGAESRDLHGARSVPHLVGTCDNRERPLLESLPRRTARAATTVTSVRKATPGQGGSCNGANSDRVHGAGTSAQSPGTCDPDTGACSNPTKTDGNELYRRRMPARRATRAMPGSCIGAIPVVCTAQDQCHDPGTCDTVSGTCSKSRQSRTAHALYGRRRVQRRPNTCQSGRLSRGRTL